MFQLHIAYSLELLVLAAGLVLLHYGSQVASKLLKMGGAVLTVITVLNMLCTLYYGIRYWEDGYFKTPHGAQSQMMSGQDGMDMMQNGMMDDNMMKMMKMKNKMKGRGKMPNPDQRPDNMPDNTPDSEHEEHHPDQ